MKQLIGLFLKITNKKHMKEVMPTVNIRWLVFFLRKIRDKTENIIVCKDKIRLERK